MTGILATLNLAAALAAVWAGRRVRAYWQWTRQHRADMAAWLAATDTAMAAQVAAARAEAAVRDAARHARSLERAAAAAALRPYSAPVGDR